MHRLFAAIPLPEDIAERLLPLQAGLIGAAWRERAHFHITLHFFGEVTPLMARDLDEAMGALEMPQMELRIEGAGWFGRKEPRAVYVRIAPNEALSKLAAACRRIAKGHGLPLESHPYEPHVTLAYCKDTPLPDAMAWSERWQIFRSSPFWADRFHLYESHLRPGRQSRYEAVADYPLGAAEI